jgi:hypothetical protein
MNNPQKKKLLSTNKRNILSHEGDNGAVFRDHAVAAAVCGTLTIITP